ncbi:MAG: hypothetical protein IT371_15055 [Deltaproteobacteria bacterium]|nr:hypothetical protein [Deltaproteobacteria bacterium]
MPARATLKIPESFDLSTVYVVSPERRDAAQLPGAVFEIVALFDGERTLLEVCARAQISEARGLAAVRKLTTLGVLLAPPGSAADLAHAPALPPGTESSHGPEAPSVQPEPFSPFEESFFATEPAPLDEADLPAEPLAVRLRDAVTRVRRRLTTGAAAVVGRARSVTSPPERRPSPRSIE